MSWWVWVGVAVLGGVGACGRFLLDSVLAARAAGDFPVGTLTVNASGALLLGLLTGLAVQGNLLVLTGTATLGSYTTFSTWMLETHRLAEDGESRMAIANIVLSLAVGIGAAALGRLIGAHV
ncbi:MAG TPA: fluoride efflux transporter CrcB [Solirubrobacteraceae bacterium]